MATEDKLLNGAGLSRLASDIKSYVTDQSEVYVGSTAPASGNYKIWVDTDEVAENYLKSGDNVSELTNDSGYITSSYHDSTKQNTLTAGSNITITNDTISATDTTYTAGTNITIDANNVISASGGEQLFIMTATNVTATTFTVDKTLAQVQAAIESGKLPVLNITKVDSSKYMLPLSQYKGDYVALSFDATAFGTNETFQLGWDDTGLVYEGSIDSTVLSSVSVSSSGTSVEEVQYITINGVEKKLAGTSYSAGTNIQITDNTISATDTTYSDATTTTSGLMSSTDKTKIDTLVPVSGTNDGTNWTSITIDGTTKAIPSGGSGEPSAYIKDASVSSNTLTLTKKDDTTVTFTPQDTTYTAGQNIQISDENVISATDTTYSAGTGIAINDGVISNTGLTTVPNATSTVVGGITVRLSGTTLYIRNDGQEA